MLLELRFDWTERHQRIGLVAQALVGSDLQLGEIIDIVVSQGMAELGAVGGHAGIAHAGYLHPIAAVGVSADLPGRLGAFTLDRTLPLCRAATVGEAIWVPNRSVGLTAFPDLAAAAPTAQAWAALPLLANGRPLGALGFTFDQPTAFEPVDRDYLSILANLAALGLGRHLAAPAFDGPGNEPLTLELDDLLAITRIEGVAVVNRSGTITRVNQRLCTLLGYEPRDLVGQALEILVPPRFRSGHSNAMTQYLSEPCPRPMGGGAQLLAQRADGTELPVDISLSPCASPNGVLVLAVIRPEHHSTPPKPV